MTTNFGTIINREGWEARIVDPFSPMAVRSREGRNLSKQKDNLTKWALPEKVDSELRQVGVITSLEFFRG